MSGSWQRRPGRIPPRRASTPSGLGRASSVARDGAGGAIGGALVPATRRRAVRRRGAQRAANGTPRSRRGAPRAAGAPRSGARRRGKGTARDQDAAPSLLSNGLRVPRVPGTPAAGDEVGPHRQAPAVDAGFHGAELGGGDLRDLLVVEALHVAQQHRDALLDGDGLERLLHVTEELARGGELLDAWASVDRVGPRGLVFLDRRRVERDGAVPLRVAQEIEAAIREDAKEPGFERAAPECGAAAIREKERVLDSVFGLRLVRQHAVRVAVQRALVERRELFERSLVAARESLDRARFVGHGGTLTYDARACETPAGTRSLCGSPPPPP